MAKDAIARERIDALSLRLTEQVAAQSQANRIALDAAEKAVTKAETASERRFDSVNEFRQTLTDQASHFATIATVDAKFDALRATVSRLETQAAMGTGRGAGADYLWRSAVAVIGMLIAGATLYGAFHH